MRRETIKALIRIHPDCLNDPRTRTLFGTWLEEVATVIDATFRGETIASNHSTRERDTFFDTLVSATLQDLMRTATIHTGIYARDDEADVERTPGMTTPQRVQPTQPEQ